MSFEAEGASRGEMGEMDSTPKEENVVNLEFVVNDIQRTSQIRKHAMRASWKERKQKMQSISRKPNTGARLLVPRSQAILSDSGAAKGKQGSKFSKHYTRI